MPYDPQTGQWIPGAAPAAPTPPAAPVPPTAPTPGIPLQQVPLPPTVEQNVDRITSQNSPLMQAASTRGAQAANRRGLLNTSMGVRAGQAAVIDAAVPIASQDANDANQRFMLSMRTAAEERTAAANLAQQYESSYAQTIQQIMSNDAIPANIRDKYLQHAAQVRDSNLNLVEQFYGVKLNWSTPGGRAADPPPTGGGTNPGGGTPPPVGGGTTPLPSAPRPRGEDDERRGLFGWRRRTPRPPATPTTP